MKHALVHHPASYVPSASLETSLHPAPGRNRDKPRHHATNHAKGGHSPPPRDI
jgi:hypothetical protein